MPIQKDQRDALRIADADTALRIILEGTATVTGERFFDALVISLATALNTHSAWVTEYIAETRQLRTLAYWAEGQLTRDFLIDIDGTPCLEVISHTDVVHYPDQIIQLFPENSSLKSIKAASYLGAPLLDDSSRVIGNLAVLDTRPMPEEPQVKTIFQIFAARASAELQRLKAEQALRKSEGKCRRIIEKAPEGFFIMDDNFAITDANQAFCRMVGYSREEILDRSPLRFAEEDYRQFLMINREDLFAAEFTELEGTVITRAGQKIPVLIHGSRLRDERGAFIGTMIFVIDLTQQKRSLSLAAEVQRSLLPREAPRIGGLDIAGRTLSCDEIGGDYYDYLWGQECPEDHFSVVVGDVSGHGVEAALLMTTARAFLRMRASQCGDISQIITEMNRHLAYDVADSGHFMTLSVVRFDPKNRSLRWIRAGHPPVLIYEPAGDRFAELVRGGLPLGIDENFVYEEHLKSDLAAGHIVVIGTDGIWEATDRHGNAYGIERFHDVIRGHAALGAQDLLEVVYADIKAFSLGARPSDDITLVIVRVLDEPKPDWTI